MSRIELCNSVPRELVTGGPELLLVERQISMAPIEQWRERVRQDGIEIYVQTEEGALDFAELWSLSGNMMDGAIIDLDRPWGFPSVKPDVLLTGLRHVWPGIPVTFFSVDPGWQLPILALPKPRLLYHRDPQESVPEFLEVLRPYLLKDPPRPPA